MKKTHKLELSCSPVGLYLYNPGSVNKFGM